MLDGLVAKGLLTRDEAQLAAGLPVAEDITVESDSGGHTDNRPLGPLFSAIQAVRDEATRRTATSDRSDRRRRRHRNAAGRRRGVRPRRLLRIDRHGEPGVHRVRVVRGGQTDARRRRHRRCDHGAGGRHVRTRRRPQVLKRGTMFAVRARSCTTCTRPIRHSTPSPRPNSTNSSRRSLARPSPHAGKRHAVLERTRPGTGRRSRTQRGHKMA